jgi:hypothetical protein
MRMSQLSSSSWSTSGYGVTLGKIFIPSIAQLEERETVIGNIRAHDKLRVNLRSTLLGGLVSIVG